MTNSEFQELESLVDQVRTDCNRMANLLTIAREDTVAVWDGRKSTRRLRLSKEERESLEETLPEAKDRLQQAIEVLEKASRR